MRKLYDLCVKTGSYQKDGETRNRYENIGALMEGDNGKFIFLKKTFNPAGVETQDGRESIIVSMFKEGGNNQQNNNQAAPPAP